MISVCGVQRRSGEVRVRSGPRSGASHVGNHIGVDVVFSVLVLTRLLACALARLPAYSLTCLLAFLWFMSSWGAPVLAFDSRGSDLARSLVSSLLCAGGASYLG